MKELWEAGEFIRKLRRRMFYGEFSRGHLRLLRLEVRTDGAELNWLARPADVWAVNLPRHIRDRDISLQAVKDAIGLRDLFFAALTDVEVAEFKAFRQEGRESAQANDFRDGDARHAGPSQIEFSGHESEAVRLPFSDGRRSPGTAGFRRGRRAIQSNGLKSLQSRRKFGWQQIDHKEVITLCF